MHSISLFGLLFYPPVSWLGPSAQGGYRIITEIYIVKEEIGGQV